MPVRAEHIARLRVAVATGYLPPDLGRELLAALVEAAPVAERLEARNALLRQAAAEVGGTRWARARWLAREVRALSADPRLRERAAAGLGGSPARAYVARAVEVGPGLRKAAARHLARLLGG